MLKGMPKGILEYVGMYNLGKEYIELTFLLNVAVVALQQNTAEDEEYEQKIREKYTSIYLFIYLAR